MSSEEWRQYWERHPQINRWHAATGTRRLGIKPNTLSSSSSESAPSVPSQEVLDTYLDFSSMSAAPPAGTAGDSVLLCAKSSKIGSANPLHLFLFFAERQLVTFFSVSLGDSSVLMQFLNPQAAREAKARATTLGLLVEVVSLGERQTPHLKTNTLTLRGPALRSLSGGDVSELFSVFGEIKVSSADSETKRIQFQKPTGPVDAVAACRALQIPLAVDFGMLLHFETDAKELVESLQPSTRIPLCPNDGQCHAINDRSHQQAYRHTCTYPPPCPWVNNTLHTKAFVHIPGKS